MARQKYVNGVSAQFELGLPEVTKNYKTPTSCILAKIFPPFQSDDPVIMGFQGRQGVVAVNTPGENAEPIDPRSSASTAVETDLQLVRGLSGIARIQDDDSEKSSSSEKVEPLYIDFKKGDKRNPANFSKSRKWTITLAACCMTVLASSTSASYNMGFQSMTRDLNCTEFQATIGLSMYALGFALIPLFSASFSEEFGRQPLYICSTIGIILSHLLVALYVALLGPTISIS